MERKYIIYTTRKWNENSGTFEHPLHYVEKIGSREIYDNPSTNTGKRLLTMVREIMNTKFPIKLNIEVLE